MNLINKLALAGAACLMATGASAEETWHSIGTGQYRDNFVHAWNIGVEIKDFPQMDVEIQESDETPGRYRIVDPYKNYPYDPGRGLPQSGGYIIVDAYEPDKCYVDMSATALLLGTDAHQNNQVVQMAVWSIAGDYVTTYGDWERAEEEGVFGKLENGCITFPPGTLLTTLVLAEGEIDWNRSWLHANTSGMFRLRLPDAPHLDVTISKHTYANDKISYEIDMEKDVEYTLVALVEGAYDAKKIDAIAAGTIPSQKLTSPGTVEFPFEKNGVFTLYAIPYYNGAPAVASHVQQEFSYLETEWRKCGAVHYTEAIFSSNEMVDQGKLNMEPDDYDVQIEESVATPGLFRLVNPYGPPYVYASVGIYDTSRNYYMIIDATDPEAVFIPRMESIGLSFDWGRHCIWSRADRFMTEQKMTKEEVRAWEAENYPVFGRHADNKITFPENSLYLRFVDQPTQPTYWANTNGKFLIELKPGQVQGGDTSIEMPAAVGGDAPEVWYTLQGTRLSQAPEAAGIYICRRGAESRKVVIR